MAKKVMSLRLDDDLRDKLSFIAEREYRTLANQITLFLIHGVNAYFSDESVSNSYMSLLRSRAFAEHHKAEAAIGDIPF